MDKPHQVFRQKQHVLVNQKAVIFQHDNVRPHATRITAEKLDFLRWEVLLHPVYPLDVQKAVILQHNNVRPHAAQITAEKFDFLRWEVLLHPVYPPDIAPFGCFDPYRTS